MKLFEQQEIQRTYLIPFSVSAFEICTSYTPQSSLLTLWEEKVLDTTPRCLYYLRYLCLSLFPPPSRFQTHSLSLSSRLEHPLFLLPSLLYLSHVFVPNFLCLFLLSLFPHLFFKVFPSRSSLTLFFISHVSSPFLNLFFPYSISLLIFRHLL